MEVKTLNQLAELINSSESITREDINEIITNSGWIEVNNSYSLCHDGKHIVRWEWQEHLKSVAVVMNMYKLRGVLKAENIVENIKDNGGIDLEFCKRQANKEHISLEKYVAEYIMYSYDVSRTIARHASYILIR